MSLSPHSHKTSWVLCAWRPRASLRYRLFCLMLSCFFYPFAHFNGHFKDGPILAGVVQLDWAVAAICKQYNIQLAVKNVEVLKFQVVITPGLTMVLAIEQKALNKYVFSYRSAKGQHASGRIVFESVV